MYKVTKKTLIISLSAAIAIILLLGIAFGLWVYKSFNQENFKKIAESEFLGKVTKNGNFSDLDRWNKSDKEFVQTKFDINHPIYTYITHYGYFQEPPLKKEDSKQFQILVFYYERVGLTDWKLTDFNQNTIRNTSWNKAIQSAKEVDLSKIENYKDQTIGYLTPLSDDELKTSQQNIESDKKYEELQKQFQAADLQGKYDICIGIAKKYDPLIQAVKDGKTSFDGLDLTDKSKFNEDYLRKEQQSIVDDCNKHKPQ